MTKTCAWCGKEVDLRGRVRPPSDLANNRLCGSCKEYVSRHIGMPLQEYIDSLSLPVLVLDNDVRVKAVNTAACKTLGKRPSDMLEQMGGRVFECANSTLPGGCGRTVHCSGCAIRRTVTNTWETGEAQARVPATLTSSNQSEAVSMTLTTIKAGELVMLRLDQV